MLIGTRWKWRNPDDPLDAGPAPVHPTVTIGPDVVLTDVTDNGDLVLSDPQGNAIAISWHQLIRVADMIVRMS